MDSARQILATHRALVFFLLKMGAAYAVWFVVYDLWLLPDGRLDAALGEWVASATAAVLGLFAPEAVADGRTVWFREGVGVYIANGCNGLSALSLFVGFVLAYPGSAWRRAAFVPVGLALLVLTNVLRCVSLLVVSAYWPWMFDSVHGMHALFVFYVVIFALWVTWAHVGTAPADRPAPAPVRA